MNLNPEFQRNLWLEMTRHRLILTPVVLGAVFFLGTLLAGSGSVATVRTMAITLYCLFAFGWGTYLAGDAVVGEIKHRTWDIQKMSAIGPWAMTWGKLLGSSAFPWYGALLCLLVAILAGAGEEPLTLVLLVLGALFAQTSAFLVSLLAIHKRQALDRSAALVHLFAGLMMVAPFLSLMKAKEAVTWFGLAFSPVTFVLVSLLFWGFWLMVGSYRQMGTELRVSHTPLVWVAFLLFGWSYFAGFVPEMQNELDAWWTARLLVGFFLILAMTYCTLFADRHDSAQLSRLIGFVRQRDWANALKGLPLWVPTLAIASLLAGALGITMVATRFLERYPVEKLADPLQGYGGLLWLLAIVLFAVRDVAIVLFLNLTIRSGRADLAAVLYLSILSGLIPGILAALKQFAACALFFPWLTLHPVISLAGGAAQAALAIYLVTRRRAGVLRSQKTPSA